MAVYLQRVLNYVFPDVAHAVQALEIRGVKGHKQWGQSMITEQIISEDKEIRDFVELEKEQQRKAREAGPEDPVPSPTDGLRSWRSVDVPTAPGREYRLQYAPTYTSPSILPQERFMVSDDVMRQYLASTTLRTSQSVNPETQADESQTPEPEGDGSS